MLFELFSVLVDQFSFLNVFKYLTVRTGLSMFTAMIVVFSWQSINKVFLIKTNSQSN